MKNKKNIQFLETAFRDGDDHAFKTLFDMYYDKLSNYVNSFTNDPSLTKDIVQDSFVKLWNAKSNFDLKQSISAYLYKTAYNTFIDNYRKHKHQMKMLDTLAYTKKMEIVIEDDEVKAKKLKEIKKAIDNLPPKCQKIFKMAKLEGYTYQEIADSLNISSKTVDAQIAKAFAIVRKEIKSKSTFQLFINMYWQ